MALLWDVPQHTTSAVTKLRKRLYNIAADCAGQDMIEYALLAASVAVLVAGSIPTQVVPVMSTLYSKLSASMNAS